MKNNTFTKKSIGLTWLAVLEAIYLDGDDFYDEGRPLKEITGLRLLIEEPDYKDKLVWEVGNNETIELFRKSFLGKEEWLKDVDIVQNFGEKDAISYSVRLFNYEGFDQIQNVINRLSKIPESKRCMVITPMPHKDWGLDYLPCIDTVHFLLRNGRLDIYVHCRGLDFAQKAYANFICLAELQKYVCDGINKKTEDEIQIGKMDIMVDSAHIYSNTLEIAKKLIESGDKYTKERNA